MIVIYRKMGDFEDHVDAEILISSQRLRMHAFRRIGKDAVRFSPIK